MIYILHSYNILIYDDTYIYIFIYTLIIYNLMISNSDSFRNLGANFTRETCSFRCILFELFHRNASGATQVA